MKSFACLLLFLLSGPLPMTVSADGSRGETSSRNCLGPDECRSRYRAAGRCPFGRAGADSRGRNGGHRFGDDELSMYAGRLSAQTVGAGAIGRPSRSVMKPVRRAISEKR